VKPSIPLSLYIHIPWCERKCPYCDFNSHENYSPNVEPLYVSALLNDLDQQLELADGRPISTIFFGGGTPSLFSAAAIDQILKGVRSRVSVGDDCEITLESNPGSAEAEKYKAYKEAGVNRLSIGIQSFDDSQLSHLGRIHSSDEAKAAIDMAFSSGFERLNVDLMYGLENQTRSEAIADIETALSFGVSHLSWYQLTIERNTAFWSKPPALPDADVIEPWQGRVRELLGNSDIHQYEVSAWSREGEESRHNLNYWQFGDYLAIGAGAHGKVSVENCVYRFQRTRHPAHYLEEFGHATTTSQINSLTAVPDEDMVGEFMMNALRLRNGVPLKLLSERTGKAHEAISGTLESLEARGLMVNDGERLETTPLGYRYLDSVVESFF
jgi:putative oxygen-independent coproporphyrinogen III oxidase